MGYNNEIERLNENSPSSSKWTKKELLISSIFCLAMFTVGSYFTLPSLTFTQEASKKGLNMTLIGVTFSVFELVLIITSPLYGAYLTQIGAKELCICGLVISGGSTILFGVLEFCPPGAAFAVMSIIVRVVEGVGSAAFLTSCYAILANTFTNRVATMIGYLESSRGLGLMTGFPLGGFLYQMGGFILPYLVMGMFNIIMAFLIWCLLPPPQDSFKQQTKINYLMLLKQPVIWLMAHTAFLICTCFGFLEISFALHIQAVFNLGSFYVGLLFLFAPGSYALACPFWGYLGDKKPRCIILFTGIGLLSSGIGYMLLGPAPILQIHKSELWLVIMSLILTGTGSATITNCLPAMSKEAIEKGLPDNLDTYGQLSGIKTMFTSSGILVGPLLGGFLVDTVQFEWASFIIGSLIFLNVLIMMAYQLSFWCHRNKLGKEDPS